MKDYLYIPLGGNQVKSKAHLYINLCIVFLISGLWHGAAWSFVVWGTFHGMFLILDRIFLLRIMERIGKIPSMLITYVIVLIGWCFFRSPSLPHAFHFIASMFKFADGYKGFPADSRLLTSLILAILFSFAASIPKLNTIQNHILFTPPKMNRTVTMGLCGILLLLLSISSISTSGFNPFIYFKF